MKDADGFRRNDPAICLFVCFHCLFFLSVTGLSGCASTRQVAFVNPVNTLTRRFETATSGSKSFSPKTQNILLTYGLERTVQRDSSGTLEELIEIATKQNDFDAKFAVSELARHEARRHETRDREKSRELYLTSLLYAYEYLFDPAFQDRRNAYDPHFHDACRFCNDALESILRMKGNDVYVSLNSNSYYTIRGSGNRDFRIRCRVPGGKIDPDELEAFKFTSDYSVTGLRQEFRQHGIGVPLLAKRKLRSRKTIETKYTPVTLTFPMTAVLRLLPPGRTEEDGLPVDGVIELYDPLDVSEVLLAGQRVPLESDITTPIAYTLSDPRMAQASTFGLVRSDLLSKPINEIIETTPSLKRAVSEEEKEWFQAENDDLRRTSIKGLYLMQPYEEGKIPVVFIHGLWSSPMTWMEMFNALRGDPELRARYQFLFYFYPTGQPFWISAAELRKDLKEFRQTFDPNGVQPVFDEMILIGHSMGGLIAQFQTMDSGMEFWQLVDDETPESVLSSQRISQASGREIRDWFFFDANPSVKRVVGIATPYRGSRASNGFSRRFGKKIIKLPENVLESATALTRGENRTLQPNSLLRIETSIESLSPDNPVFEVMQTKRAASAVRYHNIAGVLERKTPARKMMPESDGVVSLESARLEPCESEILVSAGHTKVHSHPIAILEVRRILYEHLKTAPK